MREEWLPLLGNVSQSCISRQGAPVSFSQVTPSSFSWALIGWFTCASVFLCYPIISQCVCSVFYSKSPWEARAFAAGVVRKISWLVLMFCCVSRGQAGLIPVLFVSGVLPDPQLCLPPPLLQRYFSGLVRGAVPTQIETCQCALCLLWHRLEWRFSPTASIRAPGSSQTDRQAESKLLAQAALFAHAWRW